MERVNNPAQRAGLLKKFKQLHLAKHLYKGLSNILSNKSHPIFLSLNHVPFRLITHMVCSLSRHAHMRSQPGPASGQLSVSSPPKGLGFHVRFSEKIQEEGEKE